MEGWRTATCYKSIPVFSHFNQRKCRWYIFHVIFTSFIVHRSCYDLWYILLQHLIIKFYCVCFGIELFSRPMQDWHKGINRYYFEWQNWIIHVFTICNLFKIELIQVDLPCFGRMMHTAQFSVPEVAPLSWRNESWLIIMIKELHLLW